MDIDSLRNELEELLKKNPDDDAPQGFRDRFEAAVARMSYEGDGIPPEAQEAELQQIRDEAEAAAKAAGGGEAAPRPKLKDTAPAMTPRGGDPGPEKVRVDESPAAGIHVPASEVPASDRGGDAAGPPAMLQRFGLPAAIALVVLIAAYFVLRG